MENIRTLKIGILIKKNENRLKKMRKININEVYYPPFKIHP